MLSDSTRTRVLNVAGYGAWLAGTLWLLASGEYAVFLAPGLWVLLAATAAMLAAIIVVTLPGRQSPGAAPGMPVKWAILLLPLVFLLLVPSGEPGSFTFDQRALGSFGPGGLVLAVGNLPASMPDELSPEAHAQDVTLSQLYTDFRQLIGRRVSFIGRVNPRKDLAPGTVLVFRFTIACCAADAQPVAALVALPPEAKIKRDTWVQVEGVLGYEVIDGVAIPAVRADAAAPIRRPLRPYLN